MGRVTSAFPSHAPTPVLYEESLKQIAELSSISLAITGYTHKDSQRHLQVLLGTGVKQRMARLLNVVNTLIWMIASNTKDSL